MEPVVGTRIGERYVVLGALGEGGMGVVLRARDERLGRVVAIKLLPPSAVGDDDARKRLVREARAAAALDHPSIVHMYDVGETPDGGAFLVMELVKGRSLGDHLRSGTLSVPQRVRACVEVARALQYAHDQGFLHRDIKPDNVMVRDDGRVVVLDFGLAKTIAPGLGTTAAASLVSSKSTFVGTPAYASPEQARGEDLGPASDQFSFAVSLFELVSGELPWEGKTPLEVISHILRGEPKRLRAAAPDASEALESVLARALDKDTTKRFPSMGALADALVVAAPDAGNAPSLRDVGVGPVESVASAQLRTLTAPATTRGTAVTARPRWQRLAVAGGGLAIAAGIVWTTYAKSQKAAPGFGFTSKSTVACPLLRATDPDLEQTGWLGAAGATLVCSRVQMALGGSPDRTRIPAELLGLPRQPREGFPAAPYDEADAAAKTLAAAKAADAFIDGAVEHASDFHVSLDLRTPAGDVIEHGDGRGPTLLAAVRAALPAVLAKLAPGTDEAYAKAWFAGTTARGRVAAFDLHVLAVAEDTDGLREACRELPAADLGTLAPLAAAVCANKLFTAAPALPTLDESGEGALLTTASALRFAPVSTQADRDAQAARASKLHTASDHEAALDAKALLLAGEAEIDYQAGDNAAAALAARAAIQASPKIADLRGNAWHRQSFVASLKDKPVLAAHAAWLPWEPFAWANLGRSLDTRDPRGYQRAYVLAQHGYWAVEYGVRLLEVGRPSEAHGVAAVTHDPHLAVLIAHAEHHPASALALAIDSLRGLGAEAVNGNLASRLAVSVIALDAFLGKAVDPAVTDYVKRFVFAEPPALTRGATTLGLVLGVCAQVGGPTGEACIERVATLFDGGYFGGATAGMHDGIEGTRHYIKGDFTGAAKLWRLITSEWLVDAMSTPFATAFDRAGEPDLADRVDDPRVAAGKTSPDAELCYARKALRAEKRGDLETARTLARTFVERWEGADERPPMLADMKRILARR